MTTKIRHIFDRFMIRRFSHVDITDPYYSEWKTRFENGMEWQNSDYANRAALQAIAPGVYPSDKDGFFIRS